MRSMEDTKGGVRSKGTEKGREIEINKQVNKTVRLIHRRRKIRK